MSKYLSKTWVVCLLACVSCFLWGSAFPGVKIGYEWFQIASEASAAQIVFAGCRFFLAGIMVIFFGSLSSGRFLRPEGIQWKHAAVISLFQTILQYILFYIGAYGGNEGFDYRRRQCIYRHIDGKPDFPSGKTDGRKNPRMPCRFCRRGSD